MGLLAGKYAPFLGAGAAGLLGAGGSILGNLQDTEQGEGPARIATEALAAGVNALPAGLMLGALPQGIRYAQKNAVKSIPRASKDLRQQARQQINQQAGLIAGSQIASIPISAGIGGLLGGGLSNVANAIGIPGMQPGMVINPESYGSSNLNYTV
jgi:hypothetical protein